MSQINTDDRVRRAIDENERRRRIREIRRQRNLTRAQLGRTRLDDPNRVDTVNRLNQLRENVAAVEAGERARAAQANPLAPRDINASRAELRQNVLANTRGGPLPEEPTAEQVELRRQILQRQARDQAAQRSLNQPGEFVAEADALRSIGADVTADRERRNRDEEIRQRLLGRFGPLQGAELARAQAAEDASRQQRLVRQGADIETADEILSRPTPERLAVRAQREREELERNLERQAVQTRLAQLRQEERTAQDDSGTEVARLQREIAQRELRDQLRRNPVGDLVAADATGDLRLNTGAFETRNILFNADEINNALTRLESQIPDLSRDRRAELADDLLRARDAVVGGESSLLTNPITEGAVSALGPIGQVIRSREQTARTAVLARIEELLARLSSGV